MTEIENMIPLLPVYWYVDELYLRPSKVHLIYTGSLEEAGCAITYDNRGLVSGFEVSEGIDKRKEVRTLCRRSIALNRLEIGYENKGCLICCRDYSKHHKWWGGMESSFHSPCEHYVDQELLSRSVKLSRELADALAEIALRRTDLDDWERIAFARQAWHLDRFCKSLERASQRAPNEQGQIELGAGQPEAREIKSELDTYLSYDALELLPEALSLSYKELRKDLR